VGIKTTSTECGYNVIAKHYNSQRKLLFVKFFTKTVLLLILHVLLFLSPCHSFQKAETELFRFFYYKKDSKAAQLLIRNADPIAREISDSLGLKFPKKIEVFIVPTFEDFQKTQPKRSRIPTWAVGVAFPSKNIIVLLKKKRVDLVKTFYHELNHILLGQAFGGKHRVPRWLDEGLAMIQAGEWSMSRLSKITGAVLTDSLIPMDNIVDTFPLELRDAELAYCQSFYFISFLKGKFGDNAFKAFLSEYSKHKAFRRAIRKTYHIGWDSMEELWLDYLKLRFSWIPIITSTGFLWFTASLIFIMGYIRKKRKSRLQLQQWTIEENLLYGEDEEEEDEIYY
jgi:hypothetical protein